MKLIVGLGNPGVKYEFTRHNAGFLMLDFYAREKGFEIKKIKNKVQHKCAMFLSEKSHSKNSLRRKQTINPDRP